MIRRFENFGRVTTTSSPSLPPQEDSVLVYETCDVIRTFEENFVRVTANSSRSLPQLRDPVLVFGMATSDLALRDNPIPPGCVLGPPSTEREMQSLTEGVTSLDAAFDLYAAECNKMVFGEGIKKKFVVFKPNRYSVFKFFF